MPMSSLDITFFAPPEGISNADHYHACLTKTQETLESIGVITREYPDTLQLSFECPTAHVKDIVQLLTVQLRIGIAKVINMDPVHHREMGSDGG